MRGETGLSDSLSLQYLVPNHEQPQQERYLPPQCCNWTKHYAHKSSTRPKLVALTYRKKRCYHNFESYD